MERAQRNVSGGFSPVGVLRSRTQRVGMARSIEHGLFRVCHKCTKRPMSRGARWNVEVVADVRRHTMQGPYQNARNKILYGEQSLPVELRERSHRLGKRGFSDDGSVGPSLSATVDSS